MIHNISVWLTLIFFTVATSSCASPTGILVTQSPSSVVSILSTSTVTSIPSSTPSPVISTAEATTPTLIPTLPTEEARLKLVDLLSGNNGCRLPCLWGIVPGESSFQEARALLAPLGSVSDFTAFKSGVGSISPYFNEDGLQVYILLDFIANSDSDPVTRIAFRAEAHRPLAQGGYEDIFDSKLFGEKVSAYTLAHILAEQGIPSSVMLATFGGQLTRGGTGGFDILLLYPHQGILVNYKTQMHLFGSNVRGCPTNAYVQMELYPPGQPSSFFESLKQTDWAVKMTDYRPLEEVTSVTVEEFYEIFRRPTDTCIETPADFWPTPEP